jgi:hypothetical protein
VPIQTLPFFRELLRVFVELVVQVAQGRIHHCKVHAICFLPFTHAQGQNLEAHAMRVALIVANDSPEQVKGFLPESMRLKCVCAVV